ncbi:MAG: AbiEi antitoxin N-terminal domain-containing protein [Candidatus Eisenbacteria bacterium]
MDRVPPNQVEYGRFLAELKHRICTARIVASRSVNRELILLHWDMRRFYGAYGRGPILQQAVAELRKALPANGMRRFSGSPVEVLRRPAPWYEMSALDINCRHIVHSTQMMTRSRRTRQSGHELRLPDLFRARDLASLGISRSSLCRMVGSGEVERIARGLYRRRSAQVSEYQTIAMVSKRVPGAVVCLLTALHMHGIGTQAPREVWIAIDRKARKPKTDGLPVRLVRFSGRMLKYAVVTQRVLGVEVSVTSPARTVVDCFRYRRKIGLDVALEALRDVLNTNRATPDEIVRAAEVSRMKTIILPYLQAIAS